jgi:translation initiation factor IF-1
MVKNTKGGNGQKRVARKHQEPADIVVNTRMANPKEPGEMYANVIRLYGNGICGVMCVDGKERMMFIRNKFRGRNKRGNVVEPDTKVLVGLRDWEVLAEGKQEKCDLLEVYEKRNHEDIQRVVGDEWKRLVLDTEKAGAGGGGGGGAMAAAAASSSIDDEAFSFDYKGGSAAGKGSAAAAASAASASSKKGAAAPEPASKTFDFEDINIDDI